MRSTYRTRRFEGTGSILLIAGAVFLGVVIFGAVGLAIYGSSLSAPQQPMEQELPDARFPH